MHRALKPESVLVRPDGMPVIVVFAVMVRSGWLRALGAILETGDGGI